MVFQGQLRWMWQDGGDSWSLLAAGKLPWVTGSMEEVLDGGQAASGPAVSPLEDLAGHALLHS